jgi:hypothetical protein
MLAQKLWRLSEFGEPAVLQGYGLSPDDRQVIDGLVRRGVLHVRPKPLTWATCVDCDCGAEERVLGWEGETAVAKCLLDREKDERIPGDDARSFALIIPALVAEAAASLGLGEPQLIAEGVWHLGVLSDGRCLILVPARGVITHPQLVGTLRMSHREGPIVLLGPSLPVRELAVMATQDIHHATPAGVLLSDTGADPLALDLARLPDGRAGQHLLYLTTATRRVRFSGKEATLSQQAFRLFHMLAIQHRRGRRVLDQRDALRELFGNSGDLSRVRDAVRELRKQLGRAFGKGHDVGRLVMTHSPGGYFIDLPPLAVWIEEPPPG